MDVFSAVAQGAQRGHLREAALAAAAELGLDALLGGAGQTAAEAARRLGLRSVHRLEALLDVLALEKLLLRAGERCVWGAAAKSVPVAARGWGRLAEVIRSDVPLDEPGVRGVGDGGEALRRFHLHLCSAGAEAAAALMAPLARAEGGALLDLGSGAGAYSKAWLDARADAAAILLDRPEVLALAKDALGNAPRASLHPADLFADAPWPRAQVVLLANLLHLYGPEEAQALVSRAAAAALPGGLVVIEDLRLEPDRSGPAEGVLFSLNMALFTERGRVHATEALLGFLAAAGLGELALRPLETAPDAVVAQGRRAREPGVSGAAE